MPSVIPSINKSGEINNGILIKPKKGATQNHILYLYCRGIEKFSKDSSSTLNFIGGFDHPDIANNLSYNTSFLAMIYLAGNFDELKETIGSIDIFEKGTRSHSVRM